MQVPASSEQGPQAVGPRAVHVAAKRLKSSSQVHEAAQASGSAGEGWPKKLAKQLPASSREAIRILEAADKYKAQPKSYKQSDKNKAWPNVVVGDFRPPPLPPAPPPLPPLPMNEVVQSAMRRALALYRKEPRGSAGVGWPKPQPKAKNMPKEKVKEKKDEEEGGDDAESESWGTAWPHKKGEEKKDEEKTDEEKKARDKVLDEAWSGTKVAIRARSLLLANTLKCGRGK